MHRKLCFWSSSRANAMEAINDRFQVETEAIAVLKDRLRKVTKPSVGTSLEKETT
jgi:hypothetical protein